MSNSIGFIENGLFSAPIVGMKFRPPAIKILELLPSSAILRLEREQDNQYDPDAIKVLVRGEEINKTLNETQLDELFSGFGFSGEEIRQNEWFLGYAANSEKTGGKFASELQRHWDKIEEVRLGFAIDGSPRVLVRLRND